MGTEWREGAASPGLLSSGARGPDTSRLCPGSAHFPSKARQSWDIGVMWCWKRVGGAQGRDGSAVAVCTLARAWAGVLHAEGLLGRAFPVSPMWSPVCTTAKRGAAPKEPAPPQEGAWGLPAQGGGPLWSEGMGSHVLWELDRSQLSVIPRPPLRGGALTSLSPRAHEPLTGAPPTPHSLPRAERLGEVHLDQHPLQIQNQPEVSAAARRRGANPQDHRDQVHHAR